MGDKAYLRYLITSGTITALCLAVILVVAGCKKKTEERTDELVFDLEEASAFNAHPRISRFAMGQYASCGFDRQLPAESYPAFESDNPICGEIDFASSNGEYHFAIDESQGTGQGYDRLYFDLDRDRDLRNDAPRAALKDPPEGVLLGYPDIEQEVCFDPLQIPFDFGADGKRPIEIMPHLVVYGEDRGPRMSFAATRLRKGRLRIGEQDLDAFLGHTYNISGRLDQLGAAFYLVPCDDPGHPFSWWGADILKAMHNIGGTYYSFSTTPRGDKLYARPYSGALGTFEVDAGGRNVQEVTMRGSLRSERTAVAVGEGMERGWPKATKRCRVPVGDYLPAYLRLSLGNLSIFISNNYHADGQPHGGGGMARVYGIEIRKDRPYVFDLSNKPEVIFPSPVNNQRVKVGDELRVEALLIDPKLDIMIRDLDEIVRAETGESSSAESGARTVTEQRKSLEPEVLITRANGEKVAEGVMPFG
ncbi:MAG: hypothetical protein JSU70_19520 [Phycisphaerales bacterium]|nr:MAG: hypothetical protein JSU70_19520 [Phycisphaerales bacterium]